MNLRLMASATALTLLCVAIGVAGDAPKLAPHPHFNDGGTLSWSVKLADAQAAAKAGEKLIFVEYGREA